MDTYFFFLITALAVFLDQCLNNSDHLFFLPLSWIAFCSVSPRKGIKNICMLRTVSGWNGQLGATGSKPCEVMFQFVVCLSQHMMWGCGDPDIIPWSPHGAKWKGPKENKYCLHSGRHSELIRRSGWVVFPTEPRVLRSGSPSITKVSGSQTGCRDSSISNQTPVTDLSPQAILWGKQSWIPNEHLSQKTCVSFNRVQIECLQTLMLFYFLRVFCSSYRHTLDSLLAHILRPLHLRSLPLLELANYFKTEPKIGGLCI